MIVSEKIKEVGMSKRIYLSDIVEKKKSRLKEKPFVIEELIEIIKSMPKKASFYEAMVKDGLSIIGEIKKASPSKGLIRADFKPVELAKEYEVAVEAVSVLVEEDYFMGHEDYFRDIGKAIALPLLYKDFVVDESQIYHAKAIGASCVLLIVAILSEQQLVDYIGIADKLKMDVLVETHTKEEVLRAVKTKAKIIGINNRDLKTFKTDIKRTLELRKYIPDDRVVISESGILTPQDIIDLRDAGLNGILVGEGFMRSDNIIAKVNSFKEAYNATESTN